MIDLHVHILPGLNDGAPDLGEALSMAWLAVEDGIEFLVATPH
ncbi:CpsB/CapC family capsule biosynthesis tyrosine phosphatase, partial [Desulfofundulus sp.]